MWTLCASVLVASWLCYLEVPSTNAASLSKLPVYSDIAGLDDQSLSMVDKRGDGVDAWSICPPHMDDVDCFYAYLRVYARLRKAAEESDRVSMRNIGKRALPLFMSPAPPSLMSSSLSSPSSSPYSSAESASPSSAGRRPDGAMVSRMRLTDLCPKGMAPYRCHQIAKVVYERLLSNIQDAELDNLVGDV